MNQAQAGEITQARTHGTNEREQQSQNKQCNYFIFRSDGNKDERDLIERKK